MIEADSAAVMPDFLAQFLQYGLVGAVLVAIMMRWLIPRWAYDQMRSDRDAWKQVAMAEQAAHQLTRDSMAEANTRAEAGMEAARTATKLLADLGHQPRSPRARSVS